MEGGPLSRSLELGDVPRPDLIGRRGKQFWLAVDRMPALGATLTAAAVGRQQPVHGTHRPEVASFVEQRGMHRRRRGVGEALAVEELVTKPGVERLNPGVLPRRTRVDE